MKDENKYTLDQTKLTPEQRDKLESYQQSEKQLQTLSDIASMVHELISIVDEKPDDSHEKEAGALLMDIRDTIKELNDKEVPEQPETVKPIVEALTKLEKAVNALDVSPVIRVDSPEVNVSSPAVDLKGIEKILKTDIPKAFKDSIGLIPKQEKNDYSPLLRAWEGISEQLISLENATRMKPLPGSIRVSNLSDIASGGGSSEVDYSVNDIEENTTSYFGFSTTVGDWLIKELTDTSVAYATVSNNGTVTSYTDAWTNRETLTYGRYDQAF